MPLRVVLVVVALITKYIYPGRWWWWSTGGWWWWR